MMHRWGGCIDVSILHMRILMLSVLSINYRFNGTGSWTPLLDFAFDWSFASVWRRLKQWHRLGGLNPSAAGGVSASRWQAWPCGAEEDAGRSSLHCPTHTVMRRQVSHLPVITPAESFCQLLFIHLLHCNDSHRGYKPSTAEDKKPILMKLLQPRIGAIYRAS